MQSAVTVASAVPMVITTVGIVPMPCVTVTTGNRVGGGMGAMAVT